MTEHKEKEMLCIQWYCCDKKTKRHMLETFWAKHGKWAHNKNRVPLPYRKRNTERLPKLWKWTQ